MRQFKRLLAGVLCITMLITTTGFKNIAVNSELTEDIVVATQTDAVSYEENVAEVDEAETSDIPLLNYLIIGSDYIETPNEQYVLVDIGTNDINIESAVLNYINTTTGETFSKNVDVISDGSVLFYLNFNDGLDGVYEVISLDIVADERAFSINVMDTGVSATFGVNMQIESEPDAWIEDDLSDDAGIVVTDIEGNNLDGQDIEVAIAESNAGMVKAGSNNDGNIVVVLDPGHGNDGDPGAVYTWNGVKYVERDLNLKIAQYCKAALEQYPGVTVYMTRTSNDTGLRLSPDEEGGIGELVQFAADKGADILVSIHNNVAGSSARGAEVYYPNGNYNSSVSTTGKEISKKILEKLSALGLTNRGAKIRNSGDGTLYPDGSLADYYGIVRQSKLCGFPGIIIEHAFVSNQSDAETFLGSESSLKALGEADAKAIAEYFDLGGIRISCKENFADIQITANYDDDIQGLTYQYMIYDLDLQQWSLLQDWTTSNTVSWNPTVGDYWICVNVKKSDGTTINQIIDYSVDMDYSVGRIRINGFAFDTSRTDGIAVGAIYESSDANTKFRWLAYNLSTQQWEQISSWSSSNWIFWQPKKGDYWLRVEASTSDGVSADYTEVYTVKSDYIKEYLNLSYLCYDTSRTDGVSVGVGYTSSDADVKFRWLEYDLQTQQWKVISGWSSSNWTFWKQDTPGNYWVRVEAKNGGGITADYTEIYTIESNEEPQFVSLDYLCYDTNRTDGVAVGVGYTSNDENVEFRWLSYNLQTQQWEQVSGWSKSNWLFWQPKQGDFWIHVEARTSDGTTSTYTETYSSVYDYTKTYLDITDINVKQTETGYLIQPQYVSNSSKVQFQYMIYDSQTWSLLSSWTNSSSVAWNPAMGTYWINVEAKTSDGVVDTLLIVFTVSDGYMIMGDSNTDVQQMVAYYNAHNTYPSYYASSDAPTIEAFCQIYLEEAAAEGVRAEVAFAQAMKETGYLKFGGRVNISDYNFAGIGATDNGSQPAQFSTVREGVRAQIQHLKAYASTSPLNNACVDPRFTLVTRGTAPYVEWLGINENPYGKGWASAVNYGYSLRDSYIFNLFNY